MDNLSNDCRIPDFKLFTNLCLSINKILLNYKILHCRITCVADVFNMWYKYLLTGQFHKLPEIGQRLPPFFAKYAYYRTLLFFNTCLTLEVNFGLVQLDFSQKQERVKHVLKNDFSKQ